VPPTETAIASVRAFDVTFARVAWFGPHVVWLAPDPGAPFRALTQAGAGSFPAIRRTEAPSTRSCRT